MSGRDDLEENIPSAFDFVRSQFPPGAEIVGFTSPDGVEYSEQETKAIEWQERQMDIQSQVKIPGTIRAILEGEASISSVIGANATPKFKRQVRRCYHFENSFIAVANDDTVWVLKPAIPPYSPEKRWERLIDANVPALPQDGE